MRPGPTARTGPSCGFSLAVSGITMPDAVVVSASFAWTTMRSSSGLIATLVAVVTGIPSWVQVSPAMEQAGVDASCHRAGPSSRVPVRLVQARPGTGHAGTLIVRVLIGDYAGTSTPSTRVPTVRTREHPGRGTGRARPSGAAAAAPGAEYPAVDLET